MDMERIFSKVAEAAFGVAAPKSHLQSGAFLFAWRQIDCVMGIDANNSSSVIIGPPFFEKILQEDKSAGQTAKHLKKSRVGDIHTLLFLDVGFSLGSKACYGKGHCNAVIHMRMDRSAC